MSDLTAKFGALEGQLASQAAATNAYIDTVEAKLQAIFDELDTVVINNAANARAILQAIAANDPCACGGTPTLVIPPIGTTPISISSDQCKRIQAFLHTMQEIMTVLDVASAFSVGLNFSLVSNSINEVIGAIESGSDLPVISYAEASNLINSLINYIIGNLLVGGTLSSYFSSILFDLRDGMTLATSADSAKSLYDGVVSGSSLPDYVKPVISGAAFRALYSYYFDPGTSPNLTGYDGSLCGGSLAGITECTDFPSQSVVTGGDTIWALQVPVLAPALGPTAIAGDYEGWSFQNISGNPSQAMRIYRWDAGGFHFVADRLPGDPAIVIGVATTAIACQGIDAQPTGEQFTVRVCPPTT